MKFACAAVLVGSLVLSTTVPSFAAPARHRAAAHAATMTLADLHRMMVGTWQSADDPRFTREFDADGQAVDRYAGDTSATIRATWQVFAGSKPPPGLSPQGLVPHAIYVEMKEQDDVLLFGLVKADQSRLQMVHLGRGNMLTFLRLK